MKKYSYKDYESTNNNINKYIYNVYGWMSCGLLLTSFTAWYTTKIPILLEMIFFNRLFLFTIIITQIIIVFIISNMINRLNINIAITLFMLYSMLTGLSISSIFLIYTYTSISVTFLIASLMFALMSLWGYTSKQDLTKIGNISIMILIGIIISTIINTMIQSKYLLWIISYIGIISFSILIAWDTQKLKEIGINLINNNEQIKKYSILGALILYLDFINLYLLILKLVGVKSEDENKNN